MNPLVSALADSLLPRNPSELEERIGYHFRDARLLVQALTHRSHTGESVGEKKPFNEQMEFLGDSILGFLVSEALVRRFPHDREGRLSKLKARLVSEAHLRAVAERMKIGQFLLLGKGEEQSGGRTKRALLADTVEALVAAVYLDGGMEAARQIVESWGLRPVDLEQMPAADYKSELQELLQERRETGPRYVVVKERGPEHRKVFTVRLHAGGKVLAEAEGGSKKEAQQAAAQIALRKLRERSRGTQDGKTDGSGCAA